MSKRKAWVTLLPNKATCGNCGARSIWIQGMRMGGGKTLTYWIWWKEFKRRHNRCLLRTPQQLTW